MIFGEKVYCQELRLGAKCLPSLFLTENSAKLNLLKKTSWI